MAPLSSISSALANAAASTSSGNRVAGDNRTDGSAKSDGERPLAGEQAVLDALKKKAQEALSKVDTLRAVQQEAQRMGQEADTLHKTAKKEFEERMKKLEKQKLEAKRQELKQLETQIRQAVASGDVQRAKQLAHQLANFIRSFMKTLQESKNSQAEAAQVAAGMEGGGAAAAVPTADGGSMMVGPQGDTVVMSREAQSVTEIALKYQEGRENVEITVDGDTGETTVTVTKDTLDVELYALNVTTETEVVVAQAGESDKVLDARDLLEETPEEIIADIIAKAKKLLELLRDMRDRSHLSDKDREELEKGVADAENAMMMLDMYIAQDPELSTALALANNPFAKVMMSSGTTPTPTTGVSPTAGAGTPSVGVTPTVSMPTVSAAMPTSVVV